MSYADVVIPNPWPDLNVTVRIGSTASFIRQWQPILCERRTMGRRYAAWVQIERGALDVMTPFDVASYLRFSLDRQMQPWRYPDRNPMPVLDLTPRLTRLGRAMRRAARRLRDAVPTRGDTADLR